MPFASIVICEMTEEQVAVAGQLEIHEWIGLLWKIGI